MESNEIYHRLRELWEDIGYEGILAHLAEMMVEDGQEEEEVSFSKLAALGRLVRVIAEEVK